MTLFKNVNGENIQMTAEEEAAILAEWAKNDIDAQAVYYAEQRVNAYPKISDQIDIIYKTFLHLKNNGIDLGTIGSDWVDQISLIKSTYPKP